ncbi:MAG: (d)CMP kinase [bacterium]
MTAGAHSTRRGIVVAIDGPSGAGKSTTARAVAARLGYDFLDTGAMYRAITHAARSAGVAAEEGPALAALLASVALDVRRAPGGTCVFVDGADVSDAIRSREVTSAVSSYSALRSVREAMVERQRRLGADGGVVVEGRDIGTVVFPNAELKVFLDASLEERARRRRGELERAGLAAAHSEVETDIARRDALDSSRAVSPLAAAADAVHLDTSHLTFEQQVDAIVALARERGARPLA